MYEVIDRFLGLIPLPWPIFITYHIHLTPSCYTWWCIYICNVPLSTCIHSVYLFNMPCGCHQLESQIATAPGNMAVTHSPTRFFQHSSSLHWFGHKFSIIARPNAWASGKFRPGSQPSWTNTLCQSARHFLFAQFQWWWPTGMFILVSTKAK